MAQSSLVRINLREMAGSYPNEFTDSPTTRQKIGKGMEGMLRLLQEMYREEGACTPFRMKPSPFWNDKAFSEYLQFLMKTGNINFNKEVALWKGFIPQSLLLLRQSCNRIEERFGKDDDIFQLRLGWLPVLIEEMVGTLSTSYLTNEPGEVFDYKPSFYCKDIMAELRPDVLQKEVLEKMMLSLCRFTSKQEETMMGILSEGRSIYFMDAEKGCVSLSLRTGAKSLEGLCDAFTLVFTFLKSNLRKRGDFRFDSMRKKLVDRYVQHVRVFDCVWNGGKQESFWGTDAHGLEVIEKKKRTESILRDVHNLVTPHEEEYIEEKIRPSPALVIHIEGQENQNPNSELDVKPKPTLNGFTVKRLARPLLAQSPSMKDRPPLTPSKSSPMVKVNNMVKFDSPRAPIVKSKPLQSGLRKFR